MEYVPQIVEILIPVLTAACGLAVGRLNTMKKRDAEKDAAHEAEMKAIKDGVKGLLRKEIIDTGMHYIGKGFIPPYGIETLKGCYAPYIALGDGDPAVAHIMSKCEALEIRSGSI